VNNRQAVSVLRDISPARIFARPTAEDLWLGPTRESVLSHLIVPAQTRVLLGPVSSGRTSILNHLAHRTADQAATLRATGPRNNPTGVLAAFLRSAGLDADGLAADEMRRLLSVYIHERLGKNRRVIVQLDDADGFDRLAWREVDFVLGLEHEGRHPELLMSLVHLDDQSSPAAAYVRQQEAPSLSVISWLEPREVSSYLRWRLDRFDLAGINTPAATRLISKCTQGCFAAIDHIAQMTLLLLRNRSDNQINVNVVREATRMLQQQHQSRSVDLSKTGNPELTTAKIIVSQAGKVIREARFSDRLLIGRSELNDLCIDNAYLSRHHAVIVRTDRGHYLSDLNSVNGIGLNGRPVHSTPIGDGDVFSIGPYRLKLRLTDPTFVRQGNDGAAAALADTAVMPAAGLQPAHLKVIK